MSYTFTDIHSNNHGENGMGIETIYEIRHELSCPQCGNNIEITITGNEYPEGAYDYDSAEISGAEFIETPSMGMVYYQDEFDVDEYAVEATGIRGLIAQLSENRDMIYDVTSREFEEIVEQVLQDDGFDIHGRLIVALWATDEIHYCAYFAKSTGPRGLPFRSGNACLGKNRTVQPRTRKLERVVNGDYQKCCTELYEGYSPP